MRAPLHIATRELLDRLVCPKMHRVRRPRTHDDGRDTAPQRAHALRGRYPRERVPDPGVHRRGRRREYLHSRLYPESGPDAKHGEMRCR